MSLHGWIGLATGIPAALLLLVALAGALTGRLARESADLLVVAVPFAVLVTSAVGLATWLAGGPPSDPLHFVYALAAALAVPVGRYLGRSPDLRRRSILLAVGAVVVLALVVRLWQTG